MVEFEILKLFSLQCDDEKGLCLHVFVLKLIKHEVVDKKGKGTKLLKFY